MNSDRDIGPFARLQRKQHGTTMAAVNPFRWGHFFSRCFFFHAAFFLPAADADSRA
jgi:hypothetical protein